MAQLALFILTVIIGTLISVIAGLIQLEPQGTFLKVGSELSGSCSDAPGPSEDDLRLSDQYCSYSEYTPAYLANLKTLAESNFTVSQEGSTLKFRLENTELKQYHILCGIQCDFKVLYDINITEVDHTLSCQIRFTKDEGGNSYDFPEQVTWLRNSHQVGETVDIKISDLIENDEIVTYTAQHQLNGETSSDTEEEKTTSDSQFGGVYTCQFSFRSEMMSADYEKREELSVKITMDPKQDQYKDGDTVTISCDVTGYPTPNITWLFNNQPISEDKFKNTIKVDGLSSAILLTDIDDKVEGGDYTCIAESRVSKVSKMKKLHVRDHLAPLWPFLGILAQVIVLIVAILLGERLRKKKIESKLRQRTETVNNGPGKSES